MIILDIETGPATNAAEFITEPKPPGSMKKAETIAEWTKTELPKLRQQALDEAALDALTGRVLVIGVLEEGLEPSYFEGPEDYLLNCFWDFYRTQRDTDIGRTIQWVTFNGHSFDWPFLIRRSWINKVMPMRVMDERGFYLDHLIDLRDRWQCRDRQAHGSLDSISRALGVGSKTGSGADFAKLYETDKVKALAYLKQDLILTRLVAGRLL